jgi:ATP adenylyltransferase
MLHEPIALIQISMKVINLMMQPHGYNVGLNQGRVAGAGLPGHLHWHLVPRWLGDVNFMPVLSDTRVIVDSLDSFYIRFKKELSEYLAKNSE